MKLTIAGGKILVVHDEIEHECSTQDGAIDVMMALANECEQEITRLDCAVLISAELANAGSSEGAMKGWETRRAGGFRAKDEEKPKGASKEFAHKPGTRVSYKAKEGMSAGQGGPDSGMGTVESAGLNYGGEDDKQWGTVKLDSGETVEAHGDELTPEKASGKPKADDGKDSFVSKNKKYVDDAISSAIEDHWAENGDNATMTKGDALYTVRNDENLQELIAEHVGQKMGVSADAEMNDKQMRAYFKEVTKAEKEVAAKLHSEFAKGVEEISAASKAGEKSPVEDMSKADWHDMVRDARNDLGTATHSEVAKHLEDNYGVKVKPEDVKAAIVAPTALPWLRKVG